MTTDIVGHVHGLVRAWVWPPAASEALAVLAELALKGGVQRTVRHGDGQRIALHVPLVRQRHGGQVGEDVRSEGLGLGVVANEFQAVDLHAHKVHLHVLLQEEAPRQPAISGLTLDVVFVRANQVALHAPRADQAVQTLQRRVGLVHLRLGIFIIFHHDPP